MTLALAFTDVRTFLNSLDTLNLSKPHKQPYCIPCDKAFSNNKDLHIHLCKSPVHGLPGMIVCPACHWHFTSALALHSHSIEMHGASLIAVGAKCSNQHSQTLSAVCPVGGGGDECRAIFHTANAVLRHLWQNHEAFACNYRPVFNALTALYSRADSITLLKSGAVSIEPVSVQIECEEPTDVSVMRRAAADGCDVMVGNLEPHTPARVLEALILDLGFEDVVVVAGPIVRGTKAYAFINAPTTVNVRAMITALKFSKLFGRRLEAEIVGSMSALDGEEATPIDDAAEANTAGLPVREGVRPLEKTHGEERGERGGRSRDHSVFTQSAACADQFGSGIVADKDGAPSGTSHDPQGVIVATRQDSTSRTSEQLRNASQDNLLPPANILSAAPAPIGRRLFPNLVWTKPVEMTNSVARNQHHSGSPNSIEGCEAQGQAQVASPTPRALRANSDLVRSSNQSSSPLRRIAPLHSPVTRIRSALPAEKVNQALISANTSIAASRPTCLSDKSALPALKRKRNDSANVFLEEAERIAGVEGGDDFTQSARSVPPRRVKRPRHDSAVTVDANAETSSHHGNDSPQHKIPVAVMVSPRENIPSCSQDEWYGRLTPHGEVKRHELYFRYRERHSIESDSQSPS